MRRRLPLQKNMDTDPESRVYDGRRPAMGAFDTEWETSDTFSGEIAGDFMFWPTRRTTSAGSWNRRTSTALRQITKGRSYTWSPDRPGTEALVTATISILRQADRRILLLQWATLNCMTEECSIPLTPACGKPKACRFWPSARFPCRVIDDAVVLLKVRLDGISPTFQRQTSTGSRLPVSRQL